MKGFIAIDGGGSKTELVLFNELGNIFAHKIVSCTNPNDIGMDNAFNVLFDGICLLMNVAKEENLDVEGILLAIAGIEFGDSKEVLKNKLIESLNFNNIKIDGDLASVKELGLSNDENGIVIISGTGFNMAIKKNNEFTNIGGWGYLADDYLSGFDLGKDALIYSSRAINKVGKDTILVDLLEEHFSNTLWYSMAEIYNKGIKGVASLSKLVVEAYKRNDEVAINIIDKRINSLANVILNNTNDVDSKIKVCLFGGIFENNPFIVEKLQSILKDNYTLQVTRSKTVYGSVALALRLFTGNVSDAFRVTFDNEYKGLK